MMVSTETYIILWQPYVCYTVYSQQQELGNKLTTDPYLLILSKMHFMRKNSQLEWNLQKIDDWTPSITNCKFKKLKLHAV